MAFEPGGRADKLGNRHEGRWVAKQLLRLLMEEVKSVTVEAVGDDERGVDLWVEMKNESKQAQQCKARNASKEYWTVGDLKSRGVFDYIQLQLKRNDQIEFVLVSGVPFTNLHDICHSARNSNNSEEFYQFQIKGIGSSRLSVFEPFCRALLLNPQDEVDRYKAYLYLKRIRIEVYPDNDNNWHDLLTTAGMLLSGKPEAIVDVLSNYVLNKDKLGIPIHADEIIKYLELQGFYPKKLAYDHRIAPVIERFKVDFDESIRPRLINGSIIPREETKKCLDALKQNGLIILHGPAGSGKSGVIFGLTQELQNIGIIYLPIRLDRCVPANTPEHFGDSMGLPDSPVSCLEALAEERPCCLILDQLDAIRWTAAHSASALDVCKELIRQIIVLRQLGKKISVILSCRTFDLQHDPEIKAWLDNVTNSSLWTKIEVQLLSENLVRQITGTTFDVLTKRQRDVLRNPQNLAMWIEINGQDEIQPFKSATELLQKFWDFKTLQLEKYCNISTTDINKVIDVIIAWGEKNGTISAPARIARQVSPKASEALESYGILQEQQNKISFCHQSYLGIANQIPIFSIS